MKTINIKNVKINYINFFNKLVLNKNLLYTKKIKNIFIKINKVKQTSKIVTLRAPKHFKIGRNHYSVITNKINYKFKLNTPAYILYNNSIYTFITRFKEIIKNKKYPKTLSMISKITITYNIKNIIFII